ncbi:BTB/POZ domain-containing protein 2-like [Hyposmocoma kahamanoa]|uniref:BTB/POZ domain-containing protein 2-like n=1 Tax=Hyposmocoma kahamanoa TaxID=1477025 RepID=UPI000E6D89CA|nr:BTB/POZ domain-containing protein 2-like [Hyposmocoma kahamanoa]
MENHSVSFWSNIQERTCVLWETSRESDCEFHVGMDNQDKGIIKAHKTILASASPVFDAMLFGPMAEQSPILVTDMDGKVFKGLMEYIYCGDVVVSLKSHPAALGVPYLIAGIEDRYREQHSSQMLLYKADIHETYPYVLELYYAGEKYLIPGLQKACTEYVKKFLTADRVIDTYTFAMQVHAEEIIEACIKMICSQSRTVFNSDEFLGQPIEIVEKIFKLDFLNVESEWELYEAAEKYARRHQSEELHQHVPIPKKLLQHIRFLSMTSEELASKIPPPGFSKDIIFSLLMNVCSQNTYVPMPEGFSVSRVRRTSTYTKTSILRLKNNTTVIEEEKSRTEVRFSVRVHDLSELESFQSTPFYGLNNTWHLEVIKHGYPDKYLSVCCKRLGVTQEDTCAKDFKAKYKFTLKDHTGHIHTR